MSSSPPLSVQLAAIPISLGVAVDSVLIQHWPAMEYLIAVTTVMRVAAHVSYGYGKTHVMVFSLKNVHVV